MKTLVRYFIAFWLVTLPFYANELSTQKSLLERYLESLDTQVSPLENAFLWVADGTDSLFSGNREEVETLGKTHATIRFSSSITEGGHPLFGVKVKAHVDLPKTRDRLKLVFSSDDRDDYVKDEGDNNPKEALRNKDYLLGLRFIRPQEGLFKYYFQAGVKLRSPIDPYVRFVMSYEPQWFTDWDFLAKQVVSYFYHQELETKSSLIWTRELWAKWFFSHYDALYYEEDEQRYESVHALTLEHPFRGRQRVGLDLSMHLIDDPTQEYELDYYNVRFGYHKQLTDNFGIEVVPSVILEKERDFKPRTTFELNFLYRIGRF